MLRAVYSLKNKGYSMQNNIKVSLLPSSFSYRMKIRFSFIGYIFSLTKSCKPFRSQVWRNLVVLNTSYVANFGFKQGKSGYRVGDDELLYTVSSAYSLLKAIFHPVSWRVASTF